MRLGVGFLLIAGLISLSIGNQFLDRQRQHVTETSRYQRESISRNARYHAGELGLMLYYTQFALVNETAPINALSIGQRDVNPSIQRVTIRGLEGQKYDADLTNPANLLSGNLDFSFVLIYLFPLLIIAFTYNLVSEEKENGTWKLMAVQSRHLFGLLLRLFAVRIVVIYSVLLGLLAVAVLWSDIPFDGALALYAATSVLYLLAWFGLCFWVVSLNRQSSVNAIVLVTMWLSMVIVLPALLNSYIASRYPVPEAFDTMVRQRKGYHEKWDMDKQTTMNRFNAHYPQFKRFPFAADVFSWQWYYAMQQMGDDDAASQSAGLQEKLRMRETVSQWVGRLLPSLHTQLQLNDVARSGLGNQLRFLDATSRFHEQKRLYFYPKIFTDVPVSAIRWNRIGVETFSDPVRPAAGRVLLPLLLFAALFAVSGWYNFRRNLYRL